MGSHKLDYTSENKGSLCEPGTVKIDKESINQHKAQQRRHNFNLSFELGSQFETDKGRNKPFRISVASAQQVRDKLIRRGNQTNEHKVKISHGNAKNDYKSSTALQQNGYKAASSQHTSRN